VIRNCKFGQHWEFVRTTPVPLGKVTLEDALVLHKGGIAAVDQGKNLDFQLK